MNTFDWYLDECGFKVDYLTPGECLICNKDNSIIILWRHGIDPDTQEKYYGYRFHLYQGNEDLPPVFVTSEQEFLEMLRTLR